MHTIEFEKAQAILRPFAKRDINKALRELILTLIMLWSGIVTSFFALQKEAYWLLLLSIPITIAFMCRSYVIEHDCGHQSFLKGGMWNDLVGNILGFGIMIPYGMWKFIHNSHHLNVGNLDLRNFNPEVWTMTVKEFREASTFKRTMYRIMRSRFSRLIIVPTINYGIGCRLIHPNFSLKAKLSVILHDLIYLIIFWIVIYKLGFYTLFIIYLLPLILFFGIAAYTFYGQHQFEDTYWRKQEEYDWKEATFHGATDLQAPAWYRWLIGNVVYHTAHHIYFTVPFYSLHEAQLALNKEYSFKKISITQVWQLMGLKLWDEEKQKLVAFRDLKKP
jgi:omega-6 fatty acid desaturase (delta-12 desaturase)